MPDYDLITILGPTASGKTPFAAALAHELNTEIISADSRQIYRGMDLGTGKDLADYTAVSYTHLDVYKRQLYKNKQSLGMRKGEDIMELGKDEYVYKTRGMNIFFGIKDKQMYATNDELLYKSIGKTVDKSIKDAPYAADMKGKTVFMAINACLLYTSDPHL